MPLTLKFAAIVIFLLFFFRTSQSPCQTYINNQPFETGKLLSNSGFVRLSSSLAGSFGTYTSKVRYTSNRPPQMSMCNYLIKQQSYTSKTMWTKPKFT